MSVLAPSASLSGALAATPLVPAAVPSPAPELPPQLAPPSVAEAPVWEQPSPLMPLPSPMVEVPQAPTQAVASIDTRDDLQTVAWTVEQSETIDSIAGRWGLKRAQLLALNPGTPRRARIDAGTRLRVYEQRDEQPTRSIGSPNKGRLEHGMPLPEGPYWTLRERRARTYGARNTITALVNAMSAYGNAFTDPPPVSVGEISARRGGRAAPHRSHRTGRDVDLGYILTTVQEGGRWRRADSNNFDVEKNWALIEALVATGEVQQIFISNRLQRLLRPHAAARLTSEQMGMYFRMPGQDPKHVPILKHWDGHRDHMHVRFHCEDGNGRCRSRSSKKRRVAS